jgi:hypothetical protein
METAFRELFKETDYAIIHRKLSKWLIKYGGHAPHQYLIEDLFCRVETDDVSLLIPDLLFGEKYELLREKFQINRESAMNTK